MTFKKISLMSAYKVTALHLKGNTNESIYPYSQHFVYSYIVELKPTKSLALLQSMHSTSRQNHEKRMYGQGCLV